MLKTTALLISIFCFAGLWDGCVSIERTVGSLIKPSQLVLRGGSPSPFSETNFEIEVVAQQFATLPKEIGQVLHPYVSQAEQCGIRGSKALAMAMVSLVTDFGNIKRECLLKDSFIQQSNITTGHIIQQNSKVVDTQDQLIQHLTDDKAMLNLEVSRAQAKYQAVMANRIVLETSLILYASAHSSKGTFTDRFKYFRSNVVLSGLQLSAASETYRKELQNYGLGSEAKHVKAELDQFVHQLSIAHHFIHPDTGTHRAGIYIGGSEPLATALAICMLHLQKLGFCNLDLYVLDAQQKEICMLTGGAVAKI